MFLNPNIFFQFEFQFYLLKKAIYKIRMLIQKCFDLIVRNWRKEKNTISQDGTGNKV